MFFRKKEKKVLNKVEQRTLANFVKKCVEYDLRVENPENLSMLEMRYILMKREAEMAEEAKKEKLLAEIREKNQREKMEKDFFEKHGITMEEHRQQIERREKIQKEKEARMAEIRKNLNLDFHRGL